MEFGSLVIICRLVVLDDMVTKRVVLPTQSVAGRCSIDLSEAGERAWVAQVQGQLDQTSEYLLQAAENFKASNKNYIDGDTQDKRNHRREDLWQSIAKNLRYAS
jgi:hypothetical protein